MSESPTPTAMEPPPRFWEPPGGFVPWFAVIGFLAGGWLDFEMGIRSANLGPLPPGTGRCGLAVIGGLYVAFIGAPIAAIVFAIGGAGVGAILDDIVSDRRRA